MGKTYAEELQEKKAKFEKALETEMIMLESAKGQIKTLNENPEELADPNYVIKVFEEAKEYRELVIEALQDKIDAIDKELRN